MQRAKHHHCNPFVLSISDGLEMFRNFLKSEFSEENIDFWIACEEFKTTRTNKLAQKAEQIYTDYVAVKAPRQVSDPFITPWSIL